MPTTSVASNKAKIARRVIEVLEYFDDAHREATVMDIVRRYDRPQSSTSELLCSLVELGLLHKDPHSRSYSLTPRAALLGTGGQTDMVRDGRLARLTDRLAAQTGLSVALFGKVGLKTQIVSWRAGARCSPATVRGLFGGLQEPLCDNAAGWLLMSTIAPQRCDAVLRRLNAEAADTRKFAVGDMAMRLNAMRDTGHLRGPAGFGSSADMVAMLLPADGTDHRLVAGLVFGNEDRVNAESLLDCLNEAIRQAMGSDDTAPSSIEKLPNAA